MWTCPKCETEVEPEYDVCWKCGTSDDGVEDPTFRGADDAGAIEDPALNFDNPAIENPFAELADGFPELVSCFEAANIVEAQLVSNELMRIGIPAVSDRRNANFLLGSWRPETWAKGPFVLVRRQDLTRALTWVEQFKLSRADRRTAHAKSIEELS